MISTALKKIRYHANTWHILTRKNTSLINRLQSLKSKEKSSGPKIYNSTTLHQHPSFKESNYEDDEDEDGDLINYYGSSTTPSRPKPKKREFSPETLENTNKKRLTADNLSYSPTTKPFGGNSILIQSFSIRNFQKILCLKTRL